MKDLVIIGAGSVSKLACHILQDMMADGQPWNVVGILDENSDRHGRDFQDLPVLGGLPWLEGRSGVRVVLAIGEPAVRCRVAAKLEAMGHSTFATLIHPSCWIARSARIGPGSILYPGVMVDPDVTVDRHVIINKNCTVGHDGTVGDFCTLSPGVNVSGNTVLGEGCFLGTNCSTVQGVTIGEWTVIGSGAAVTKSIDANVTAVGVPARMIKKREAGWHLMEHPAT